MAIRPNRWTLGLVLGSVLLLALPLLLIPVNDFSVIHAAEAIRGANPLGVSSLFPTVLDPGGPEAVSVLSAIDQRMMHSHG